MNEFTDFKTYKMKNQKTYQYVFDYFLSRFYPVN